MAKKNPIQKIDFAEKFKDDYLEYGMYVIRDRAIPDVQDGLKPVQRRILYTFYEDGLTSNKPRKKSAKVIGDVIGKYHPHGDSAAYEALVKMSREWTTFIPPVFVKGNKGNIQGDPAAAMRYTESKLSEFGDLFVQGLKPGLVEYQENYSNDDVEPKFLPVRFPYLLIAGATGIAVGMRTSIPTHNPKEVIDATIAYIKNPKIKTEDLMTILPGPDFPTGGTITNKENLLEFYKTGTSSIYIRGNAVSLDKTTIKIDTIPFTKTGQESNLFEEIYDKIRDKKITGAISASEFSNKDGINIEIKTKSGADHKQIINELYANTSLEDTMSLNFLTIVDGAPKVLSLIQYLEQFYAFQQELVINQATLDLNKAEKRLNIVDALIKVLPDIDAVIDLVRSAKTQAQMKEALTKGKVSGITFAKKANSAIIAKYKLNEDQAEAILSTQLRRLSKLDEDALIKEQKDLQKAIKAANDLISSKTKRKALIVKELEKYSKLFDIKRQTKLASLGKAVANKTQEVISTFVTLDKYGYVKQLTEESTDDQTISMIQSDTTDNVGLFTNKGNFYKIKLEKLPFSKTKDKGTSFAGLAGLETDEFGLIGDFGDMLSFNKDEKRDLVQISSDGLAKIVSAKEFVSTRSKIVATKFKDENNTLVYSKFINPDAKFLVLITNSGLVKKIKLADISHYGKASAGMRSGNIKEDLIKEVYQVSKDEEILINNKPLKASEIPVSSLSTIFKQVK